jgi:hypothetical protein
MLQIENQIHIGMFSVGENTEILTLTMPTPTLTLSEQQ